MKRIVSLALTLIVLLAAVLPAHADDPVATPDTTAIKPLCPWELPDTPDCLSDHIIPVDVSGGESIGQIEQALADAANSMTGPDAISLARYLPYIRISTSVNFVPTTSPTVFIMTGATCRAFIVAEGLPETEYYRCVAIVAFASGNIKAIVCPAVEGQIAWLTGLRNLGSATAAQKKYLEFLLAQVAALGCTAGVNVPVPTPEPIADPALPDYCPTVAFTHEDGECVFVLEGELTTSEVAALYRAAHDADPFLGASDIDTIMQYLQTHTTTTFGFFAETRVLIGKTCRDLADALNGGYVARAGHYSNCVDALARISADFKQLGCPALDALIVRLTALQSAGTIMLAQKKTLESSLAAYAALCANGR